MRFIALACHAYTGLRACSLRAIYLAFSCEEYKIYKTPHANLECKSRFWIINTLGHDQTMPHRVRPWFRDYLCDTWHSQNIKTRGKIFIYGKKVLWLFGHSFVREHVERYSIKTLKTTNRSPRGDLHRYGRQTFNDLLFFSYTLLAM